MPFKAKEVKISEKTLEILENISNSRTRAANQIQRAKIIMLANKGKNNREIGETVSLNQDNVSKWRCRFVSNIEYLRNIEATKPKELEKAIESVLKDAPRPGHPCEFTEEQIIRILEMACRKPTDHGFESSHWSTPQLAKAVVNEGIVDSISPASINRFLKSGRNKTP